MNANEIKVCCICGKKFTGYGNNPEGAVKVVNNELNILEFKENDRCCDNCNFFYVIPGRLILARLHEKSED